jgi:hypothetical protein
MSASASTSWDPQSLIEPEFILPEQLQDGNAANRSGEFGLLWAIFTDGLHTYCGEILKGTTTSLAYREVDRWIFRPDSDALTSFSNLCELFSIDPRRLRRGLLRFRQSPDRRVLEILKVNAA